MHCTPVPPPPSATDREPPAFLYYKKALDCIENGQYEKALALLDTAIVMKSEFAQFYYAQGQVYELLGNTISAGVSYERALRYKSHYPDTWKKLAHYLHGAWSIREGVSDAYIPYFLSSRFSKV